MDRSCDDCRAWTELINLLKENFDEQYYKFFALDIPQNEGEELIKKIAPNFEPAYPNSIIRFGKWCKRGHIFS